MRQIFYLWFRQNLSHTNKSATLSFSQNILELNKALCIHENLYTRHSKPTPRAAAAFVVMGRTTDGLGQDSMTGPSRACSTMGLATWTQKPDGISSPITHHESGASRRPLGHTPQKQRGHAHSVTHNACIRWENRVLAHLGQPFQASLQSTVEMHECAYKQQKRNTLNGPLFLVATRLRC